MQNLSYENEFDLQLRENEPVGKTHFHMNGFPRRLVLTGNLKMAERKCVYVRKLHFSPQLPQGIYVTSRYLNLVASRASPSTQPVSRSHLAELTVPMEFFSVSFVFVATMLLLVCLTNRMWFSVVCTLIDNDTRHHSGQNVVAQPSESATNFDHCDDAYRCR